ncbi:MAG: hypothetical protein IT222_01700 [Crocinitomix sp.]|nr:hypothetical protein [Crocinitomix sp.]
MKNHLLITLFITLSISSFAQTDKYIELAVSETVELKAQSAIIAIRRKENIADVYREKYSSEADRYADETYYYMMQVSPEEVTPEMRQAFDDRQRQREIVYQENLVKAAEKKKQAEAAWINFVEVLKAKKMIVNASTDERHVMQNWYLYDYDANTGIDKTIYVKVQNEEQYKIVLALSAGMILYLENHEISYENIDVKLQEINNILAKKAINQAEMIALSLKKKVGSVLNVSNLSPTFGFYPRGTEESYKIGDEADVFVDRSRMSPFSLSKKVTVTYIYRFALLD